MSTYRNSADQNIGIDSSLFYSTTDIIPKEHKINK